jgi:hypothetical protein
MTETEAIKEVVPHLNLDDSDEGISGLSIICIILPVSLWSGGRGSLQQIVNC